MGKGKGTPEGDRMLFPEPLGDDGISSFHIIQRILCCICLQYGSKTDAEDND